MKTGRLIVAATGLAGAIILASLLVASPYLERREATRWTRSIALPEREHAYRTFRPMVVRSEQQWRSFLEKLKSTELVFELYKEYNYRACHWLEFEEAIRNARIDYPNEVLILVPTKGRSGSKTLTPLPLRLSSKRLRFDILQHTPCQCTADSVCECFAFAVRADKADQFEIRIDGTTTTIDLN